MTTTATATHLARQQRAEAAHIARAIGPQVVGGRYLCGYWGATYTVTAIRRDPAIIGGWDITCAWDARPGQPARSTTHATAWDARRDRVL